MAPWKRLVQQGAHQLVKSRRLLLDPCSGSASSSSSSLANQFLHRRLLTDLAGAGGNKTKRAVTDDASAPKVQSSQVGIESADLLKFQEELSKLREEVQNCQKEELSSELEHDLLKHQEHVISKLELDLEKLRAIVEKRPFVPSFGAEMRFFLWGAFGGLVSALCLLLGRAGSRKIYHTGTTLNRRKRF